MDGKYPVNKKTKWKINTNRGYILNPSNRRKKNVYRPRNIILPIGTKNSANRREFSGSPKWNLSHLKQCSIGSANEQYHRMALLSLVSSWGLWHSPFCNLLGCSIGSAIEQCHSMAMLSPVNSWHLLYAIALYVI